MRAYLNILYIILLTFFGLIILIPSLNNYFHFIPEEKGNENRTKAVKPVLENSNYDKYIKDYDSYYTDNFSLRGNYIKFKNTMEFSMFDVSPVPNDVVIGKEGWFYNKNNIANYKGANLFTKEELKKIKAELLLRTEWAAKRNVKYYLVIVPNKMTVYPEYLPASVVKLSDSTRYNQIVSLDQPPFINVVDVKKNLINHKQNGYYIYQHTDDHWNDLGAYYGYQSIMQRLSKDFPELHSAPLNDFTIKIDSRPGNMAMMMSVEKDNPEHFVLLTEKKPQYGHDGIKRGYPIPKGISDWDYEIVKVTENGEKLKCLIIRDSFTLKMVRYLQEHFKESVFIHDEWKYRMREDLILTEKPDIVLNIMVETGAEQLLHFPFTLKPDQNPEEKISLLASNGKYVCSERNRKLICNRDWAGNWETFTIITTDSNHCMLQSYENLFWGIEAKSGQLTSAQNYMNDNTRFEIIHLESGYIALKASNNKYLSLDEKTLTLFAKSNSIEQSEKFKLNKL